MKWFNYAFVFIFASCNSSTVDSQQLIDSSDEADFRNWKNGFEYITYQNDEGDSIRERLYYENNEIVFMDRYTVDMEYIEDLRTILEDPPSRLIKLGENFVSNLYIKGPRPCDSLLYYVSEPIMQSDTVLDGKAMVRISEVRNDTAFYQIQVDSIGDYYYVGAIAIVCDTPSYPRQYNFRGEFTVIE